MPAMQLTIPPSPAHLAGLRRAAQASLRDVSSEVAEEIVLAVDEAATNAILYGSGAGQPVEVAVKVKADWVEATILDHGPALPPPRVGGATPRRWGRTGGACGCCVGWSTTYVWSVSSAAHA
jgi:anti-sigma regulatory factor (Ser/Thr protein kinase)